MKNLNDCVSLENKIKNQQGRFFLPPIIGFAFMGVFIGSILGLAYPSIYNGVRNIINPSPIVREIEELEKYPKVKKFAKQYDQIYGAAIGSKRGAHYRLGSIATDSGSSKVIQYEKLKEEYFQNNQNLMNKSLTWFTTICVSLGFILGAIYEIKLDKYLREKKTERLRVFDNRFI